MYNITLSKHIFEKRNGETKSRTEGISKEGYDTIIHKALKNGLTSYGLYTEEKVAIVVHSKTKRISVLVNILNKNINVITVYQEPLNDSNFKINNLIKENKRINLWNDWIFPDIGEEGNKVFKKKIVRIQNKSNVKKFNKIRKVNND